MCTLIGVTLFILGVRLRDSVVTKIKIIETGLVEVPEFNSDTLIRSVSLCNGHDSNIG